MDIQKQILNSVHDVAVFKRRVRVLAEHLADEFDGGGSVLDVGCGDGSIAQAIMAQKPQLTFEGVDVLLRPHTAIPVQIYDGDHIPFADKSFDWVTIVDVLHHTDEPDRVLGECARVARRGVVIKDHLREGFGAQQTLRLMDWVGNKGHDVRLPNNYLSKSEWTAVFDRIKVAPVTWNQRLGLYPQPFSLAFDRSLHFIATLRATAH
jgi:2-polyprenyl-3-methyl-5-hydroxy-6-metoxy-1,4-benzoquinol methylase